MTFLIGLLVFALAVVAMLIFSWMIERRFGKDGPTVVINVTAIALAGWFLWVAADDIGTSVIGLFS